MSPRPSLLLFALVIGGTAVIGQSTTAPPSLAPGDRWQRAFDAWEAGRYPVALEDLRTLMRSPAGPEYFERVALLTGELFVTTELTPDGRNPRIAGNGAYASYETGPAASALTRIVRLSPRPETVAEISATNVVLDRAGRRAAWLRAVTPGDQAATEIVVRDLAGGAERVVLGPGLMKSSLTWSGDDQSLVFLGATTADASRTDVYAVREGATPMVLTTEPGFKSAPMVDGTGRTLVYTEAATSPLGPRGGGAGAGRGGAGGRGGGGGRGGAGGAGTTYGIVSLADKTTRKVTGTALTMSADGSTIAWLSRNTDGTTALNRAPAATAQPTVIRTTAPGQQITAPALSADGTQVAYQWMTHTDWEIYISSGPDAHRRLTRDIQHDVLPRFLTNTALLGLMGEARHRRSQLYDLTTGSRTRLFANNSIRTISPEYIWAPSADGRFLMVQADRDGDTVSTERGVSVIDLHRKISPADLLTRLDRQLMAENDLRQRMTRAYQPVADLTRQVLGRASISRVYDYEKALVDFDSKHITQPGNLKAIEYLERAYRSFGYDPALQWFTPPALQQSGGRTANVIATLRGTENPDLVYVVSSHFDSVAVGPGADDDTSGTAALLETARMLAGTRLPATIVFASFTGEEAGLLGSREFVRLAGEAKWNVAGALNNDMIGWAADSARIDNTIRFSNAGIRDIQHGAAFLFTDLVLFDAKYYRSTDAAAFYDAWGDIVGGIGSYPVLANPNYHQPTDFIETMSFKQILETAKVTAATLIHLASSPSRLKDLAAARVGSGVEITWTPSPEAGVKNYIVAYGPATDPLRTRVTVSAARTVLPALPANTEVAVKAVNARGMEGWDWARTTVR